MIVCVGVCIGACVYPTCLQTVALVHALVVQTGGVLSSTHHAGVLLLLWTQDGVTAGLLYDTHEDTHTYLGDNSFFSAPTACWYCSALTFHIFWREPWQLLTFLLVLSLQHVHLKTSAITHLSPLSLSSYLLLPVIFSFSQTFTLGWKKQQLRASREEDRSERAVSVNVKMPKQRARGMSWMVYGVQRTLLLDRLQWLPSSPAFISRSAEQTNQGGGSQAREQQSREPIISPLSPLKTQKHSKHLCVHDRKWSLWQSSMGPTEGATAAQQNTRKHTRMNANSSVLLELWDDRNKLPYGAWVMTEAIIE